MGVGPTAGNSTYQWQRSLEETLTTSRGPVNLIGVGNRLRTDDGAGLEIISSLRSLLGPAPAPGLKVHAPSLMPERLLFKLSSEAGRIIVFDAVEAAKEPGEVVFSRLADTKYGFFATHNVPLRLIPGLAARETDVFVVGVQPKSLEVGEGLTDTVRTSVRQVVAVVAEAVEAMT